MGLSTGCGNLHSLFCIIIMPMVSPNLKKIIFSASVIILAVSAMIGCRPSEPTSGVDTTKEATPAVSDTPQPTPTFTPTPEPLALMVNGEGVPLAEYEAQLVQIAAAVESTGKTRTPEEQRQLALDELINQTLMAQVAREGGFALNETDLQLRIDSLATQLGGQAALEAWITANGYTPVSFRTALARAAASAWQRDQVIATVSESAEQVRAQQILVRDAEVAARLHQQLENGSDFAALAVQYDPITGGVLGWFPRGYLIQSAVEEAAFALQPGEFSPVIETDFGYHIVYVLERDDDRILSVDARTTLQHKVLAAWLETLRESSRIEILLP